MARFSIVLPALNEGDFLAMTTESIARETGDIDYEVIVVDDGSTDGSIDTLRSQNNPRVKIVEGGNLGVARARNLGAGHATGDYLIFMDAHCRVSPGWLERFAAVLDQPSVGMVGPSFTKLDSPTPRGCGMRWSDYTLDPCWFDAPDVSHAYDAPLSTGACQAFRRDVFEELGRYDDRFTRWGSEDTEMCLRVWLLGYSLEVHPEITIAHYFREERDNYTVDDLEITYNFLRMVYLHFSPTRIQRVLRAVNGNPFILAAQERLADSEVFSDRASMLDRRVRGDDWFFSQINGPIEESLA